MAVPSIVLASSAQTVLEYFDVLVWPFIVLVMGGGSILVFRPQIAEFITKIRKARFPGGELEAGPLPQDPKQAEQLREEFEASEETATAAAKTAPGREQQHSEEELSRSRQQVQVLSRELLFERIYRSIYGSQVTLLKQLQLHKNEVPGHTSFTIHEVQNVWRMHESSTPLYSSYRDWLLYLLNVGLVQTTGDRIEISPLGGDFLLFLMRERLPARLY